MKFERKFIVGVEDIGLNNQMTNYAFLKYLEETACSHSAICGYGVNDIETKKKAWLLMDWKLEIFKRPIYDNTITVKSWTRKLEKNTAFSYRDFIVYNQGEKVAIATSRWVLFDFEKNRITKLTDDIYMAYQSEEERVFEEKDIPRLTQIDKAEKALNYTVKRSDIDINKHMHNLNYIQLAYEILPDDIYFGEELKKVSIMYKHQIKLGDRIKCLYKFENESHTIIIKSNDEQILHAIIKLY